MRIHATLDSRFVYAQVFANTSSERNILDLLTVKRDGRLAILELKAAEHIHLPLRAANYWLRIRHHLQQGDFPRYGYFTASNCNPPRRLSISLRFGCVFIPLPTHCCAIFRRRSRSSASASRKAGAADFASSCGSNHPRRYPAATNPAVCLVRADCSGSSEIVSFAPLRSLRIDKFCA
jgi:hypothetical protein